MPTIQNAANNAKTAARNTMRAISTQEEIDCQPDISHDLSEVIEKLGPPVHPHTKNSVKIGETNYV